MHRRVALLGTVVLAAIAHADDVQWKPAQPLAGRGLTLQAAARIGAPQPISQPGVLPAQIADGPRLPPPPAVETPAPVVILPQRPRFPVVPIVDTPPELAILPGPEFGYRPSPYNPAATEQPRPHHPAPSGARLLPPMPSAVPTPAPMPMAVPEPAPPRPQAPFFALPPKPGRK
jgi:hypothetical protein